MNKLPHPNTCHEISLAIRNSQTPLQMDFFQILFNLETRSKPFSRPAHLPFMLMETQFELHQWVFPLVFLLVFVLLRNHIFLPGNNSVTSFFASLIMQDIVLKGRREQGQYYTDTWGRPLGSALTCVQLGRESRIR